MAGTRFYFVLRTTEEEDSTWTSRSSPPSFSSCIFFFLCFPDFVGSGLYSGMLLFVLRACCAVVVVHAKSPSKWNGVVLSVFLGVVASTVDL